MLPIRLKIQGINSYQQEQVIEFDKLLRDKIFGIFGEVGSGKSTILDAISFALYGRMEKMNKSDGINYNLMNLKSNTFLIEYDFEVENEEKYRFVVKGRRNSKNFDDVKLTKSGYKWDNDKWLPLDDFNSEKKAEEVIGLSYDNFKRTIIIPQGKFMDFIQLGDADRTKMLKEIFNLHQFDLLEKVNELNSKNNKDIAVIEDNLIRLQDVNKDIIVEKEDVLNESIKKRKEFGLELELKDKEFKLLSSVKESFEELDKKENVFDDLATKKILFEQREKEVISYELCMMKFKPFLDNKKTISDKISESKDDLDQVESKLEALKSNLHLSKERFVDVQKDFDYIDKYKKQNEEFAKLISLKGIEEEILKSSETLKIAKSDFDNVLSGKNTLAKEIESRNDKVKKIEKDIPDLAILSEIKEWFSQKQEISNSAKELNKNLITKKELLEDLNFSRAKIITVEDQNNLDINVQIDIAEIITQLDSKLKKYDNGLKALHGKRDELVIKVELKGYSQSLKEGEMCPVCGSEHHPYPIKVEHIDEEIGQMRIRIKNGEGIINKLRKYIERYKLLQGKIESEEKNISDYVDKIKVRNLALKSFDKSYKWKEFSSQSREEVNHAFGAGNIIATQLKELRIKQDSSFQKDKQLQLLLDVKQEDLSKVKNELSSLMTKQDTLIKQLKVIKFSEFIGKNSKEIELEADILQKKIEKLERDHKDLGQEIKTLEIDYREYETTIEITNKSLNELNAEKDKVELNIQINLKENDFKSIDHVNQIIAKSIDIKLRRKEIEQFKITFETLRNEVSKLKVSLKGKTFNKEVFNKIQDDIEILKKEIEQFDNEIGSLRNEISKLKVDFSEKGKYIKEQEDKELRREDLKIMQSLFRGKGFVSYISTVRLQEVVNYANSRFQKLTRGSLKLELGEKNVFNVIDFLNGGKRRSIKTLSGGQTFQASLSLALALAGIVQKQNKSKHNFFFLDEGFGTQDEESLRLVFNTIKSLRKENRVVGLISHVPELKEEISTYLEVVNDEEKGSRIVGSWDR